MVAMLSRTLPANEIKGLYELSSYRNVVFIGLEWLSMIFVVCGTQAFFNPCTYFLAVVWIGSRLHALGILMHEAAHYRLFSNRKVNDIIGEVFLAWPITMTLKGYRNCHLAHHRHLNSKGDPDWNQWDKYYWFPKTKKQMLIALIEKALGIGFVYELTQTAVIHNEQSRQYNLIPLFLRVSQLTFYAAVVGLSIAFSFWKLLILYWGVPLLTSVLFFSYVRGIAEHYGLDYSQDLRSSRNTIGTFWESFLIAPYNVGFHLDHHLHPGVPWYSLGKLHALLLRDPEYKNNAQNTSGYFRGVLEECTQFKKAVDWAITYDSPPLTLSDPVSFLNHDAWQ
jgi:fatty acid desaturase